MLYYVLVLFFSIGQALHAQTTEKINLEVFRPGDGLSSGIITGILQDDKGFMWFGTVNGLNRFDGYKFTVYRNDPGNPASIAENYVTSLFEDSRGRMFVGTSNGGVDIFDRVQQRFIHCGDISLSKIIRSIVEDKNGVIWITRGADICRLVESKNGLSVQPVKIIGPLPEDYYKQIRRIRYAANGEIYVFCPHSICVLMQAKADTYRLHEIIRFDNGEDLEWADIVYDSVRRKVLLITPSSITGYDDYTLKKRDTIIRESIYNNCWSLDGKGNIWYLSLNGLVRNAPNGTNTLIKSKNTLFQNFLDTKSIMFWDRNQNLWLGSAGYGIAKYSLWSNRFHTVLDGMSIHNMHGGPANDFYIGPEYRIAVSKAGDATVAPLNTTESNSSAAGNAGTLWTIFDKHILRTHVLTGQQTRYPINDSGLSGNKGGIVNFDRDGKLWICFWYSPYLACFDTTTRQFTKYRFPGTRTYSAYNYTRAMLWEDNGLVWIYCDEGVFCFTKATAAWRYFPIGIKRGNVINAPIIALCNDPEDPGRYLWIGTNGYGLVKLDKRTAKCIVYDLRSHIPDNAVYGILPDDRGNLWLSSGHGLAEFNPQTGQTYIYDKSDGLQDNEFNWTAAVKLTDGTLAFGGLYGINYFLPSEIKHLPPPQVTLTGFKLFNKPVYPGDSLVPLKKDISYASELELTYRQNVFSIEFSALEYYKSAGVNYRYRLQGFDEDWIYAGKENYAAYTNLDAGTYHFFVEASYSGTDWQGGKELLTITVVPPWWKTGWFYGLIVLTIVLIVYTIYRYRLQQMLKVERLRIRIAQDLHDEIGSTLSTLSIYSKILQREIPHKNEHANMLLDNINQNATQVMDSVSDIVWSINTRYDDFKSITNRMREHASAIFDARDCMLHYEFDESMANLALPMDQRKDFYLIYKEALNNVSKYAGCSNIWITLHHKNQKIELTIRDDGAGFSQETENSGNGIQNMRDRAASLHGRLVITSAPAQGTTIRLIF